MTSCELLDKCGFFKKFQGNDEVIKNGWIKMYCQSGEKSELCARKKIRKETGNPPPDNMAPNGYIIKMVDLSWMKESGK